jgi:FAD/FMN-containing dehydrogenase
MYSVFSSRSQELEVFLFGHIGDGNLHVNTMKPPSMEKEMFIQLCKQADPDLFRLVQEHQGSISAEHGIGLLKKSSLKFSRSDSELALMKGLKQVFDPQGLLNPGKVLDSVTATTPGIT